MIKLKQAIIISSVLDKVSLICPLLMILWDILSVRVMKPHQTKNAVCIKFFEFDINVISTFCYLHIQGWSFLLTKSAIWERKQIKIHNLTFPLFIIFSKFFNFGSGCNCSFSNFLSWSRNLHGQFIFWFPITF